MGTERAKEEETGGKSWSIPLRASKGERMLQPKNAGGCD